MSVLPLDASAPEPPFEQLRTQIAARAASGELPAGTKLPSVRALAEQLGLATNTVARAYKELEAGGVVITEGRRGTSISPGQATADVGAATAEAAATYAAAVRSLGLTLPEAVRLLEQAWSP